MRNGTLSGAAKLLSRDAAVKQKKCRPWESLSAADQEAIRENVLAAGDAAVAGKVASVVPRYNEWPRSFLLPGVAAYYDFDAKELVFHLATTFLHFETHLHDLVRDLAMSMPREVAELAEVLAICEQLACSAGMVTDLDETPIGEMSGLMRLATFVRAFPLVKRKRTRKKEGETR